jgi:Flp pilus assembly protein TadG
MKQESPMNRTSSLKKMIRRFRSAQTGSVATMFALASVPLLLATGAAVDFLRFNAAQTHVQASLDAAALAAAAGKGITDAKRISAAQAVFDQNIKAGTANNLEVKAEFKVIDERIVSTAEVEVPVSFMAVAGFERLKGVSSAEVGIQADKKAEVVMVLDYSGSMGETAGTQVKYIAMKEAAKSLVTDLSKTDPDKVKFGLVPFSHHVYTTLPSAYVLGGTGSSWTGCTQDRQYPFNISDSTPTTAPKSKWNQAVAPEHAAWGCDGYVWNNLKTMDLTDNFSGIKSRLDAMKPYAWTHIAVGVEFGYQMLSPNAPFTAGAAYNDKETKKFMVVLTDGMQTEPAFGAGGKRDVASGEANLEKLCESAKANGITIITMAFDLDDTSTRKRLQNCASEGTGNFFVVDDATALASAFEAVKAAITAEVYLSK